MISSQTHTNNKMLATLRTLSFIRHLNGKVLLIRGAPTKRLWPNLLNGVGGHVEPGENVMEAAHREIREETHLDDIQELALRGLISIDTNTPLRGILLFVFAGSTSSIRITASDEGIPEWHDWRSLDDSQMLPDLPDILTRIESSTPGEIFYGKYVLDNTGNMIRLFS